MSGLHEDDKDEGGEAFLSEMEDEEEVYEALEEHHDGGEAAEDECDDESDDEEDLTSDEEVDPSPAAMPSSIGACLPLFTSPITEALIFPVHLSIYRSFFFLSNIICLCAGKHKN